MALPALALNPSTFDPVRASLAGASLAGSQIQNAGALQALQREQEQATALDQFAQRGGISNPQAWAALNRYPQLYTSALQAHTAQQNWANQQNAISARRVMGAGDENSQERLRAYQEELRVALQEGRMPQNLYQEYSSRPPTDLFLQGIIQQARPVPTELEAAHAALYRGQANALAQQGNTRQMMLERFLRRPAGGAAPTVGPTAVQAAVPSGVPGAVVAAGPGAPNLAGMPADFAASPPTIDMTAGRLASAPMSPVASPPSTAPPSAAGPAEFTSYLDVMTDAQRDRLATLVSAGKWEDLAKLLNEVEERYGTVSGISRGLGNLAGIPGEFGGDAGAFGSATGTYRGDPSVVSNPLGALGRVMGEMYQGSWFGTGVSPAEVRRTISATTNALASILKPLIRKPGEGTWTDADQALLNSILGNLTQASDSTAYYRELENTRQRINDVFGLNLPTVNIPRPTQPQGQQPAPPRRPPSLPPGSAYSPSLRQWRTPDGRMFDANGNPVAQ